MMFRLPLLEGSVVLLLLSQCMFLSQTTTVFTHGFSLQSNNQSQQTSSSSEIMKTVGNNHHLSKLSMSPQDDDTDFMASLRNRVNEVNEEETKLPMVVLDSMLPRQVLEIQVNNALLMELIRNRLEKENPFIGVTGIARLSTGESLHLRHGVEAEIIEKPVFFEDGVFCLVLKAGRRFVIDGEVDNVDQGWTEARVRFLETDIEEEEEVSNGNDRMSLARAMAKARQFTSPNASIEGNLSLIDRWIELAKKNEKHFGQINKLLKQLGEIPSPEEPSEVAFWVGALINPIPAMGVAMEIRPALLCAESADERVDVALEGLRRSIAHMDGTKRMW